MAPTVTAEDAGSHHQRLDIGRPRMAKADAKKVDADWQAAVGEAVRRAVASSGLSDKEAAAKVGVDPTEFSKWLKGERRPHFDRLFAVPELREPLCVQLARLSGADVHTHVEFRKVG